MCLVISPAATQGEIKHAYRQKVNRHHPDRFSGMSASIQKEALETTTKANKAYEELSDDVSRRAYDRKMGFRRGQ